MPDSAAAAADAAERWVAADSQRGVVSASPALSNTAARCFAAADSLRVVSAAGSYSGGAGGRLRLGRRGGERSQRRVEGKEEAAAACSDIALMAGVSGGVRSRGVSPADPPMEETTEFGIVCKPESSNVAGRPMAKRSRAEERVGGGGSNALALSLRRKIVRSSPKKNCCTTHFSCVAESQKLACGTRPSPRRTLAPL